MDLSFPHGRAVNTNISKESYLGTDFLLTLPSIDHITNKIKQLGKGSLIYKVDTSRAFRHIKIDPRDYFLLGLNHKNYYLDTCLPFRYRNGSKIFQRLSDAIHFNMSTMMMSLVLALFPLQTHHIILYSTSFKNCDWTSVSEN